MVARRIQRLRSTDLEDAVGGTVTLAALALWALVIFYAYTVSMPRAQYGVLFIAGAIGVYILNELEDVIADRDYLDAALLLGSLVITIAITVYVNLHFRELYIDRVGYAFPHEYALAAAFLAAIVYLSWRSFGLTFLSILVGALLYGYFGDLIPGILGHSGLSYSRLLLLLALDITGFYGFLTQLVAAWIALFLLYAGLLESYGAFDLIFRGAVRTSKYIDSGVAQTAVVASAVIGSINGSQTANAGMTGSFTIPMMKENGIKPSTAGGIEAVASTTGQVLPPVMGAGAFIMASLLGISYVTVITAGLIPAMIMMVCIILAVHYIASNQLDSIDVDAVLDELEDRTRRDTLVDTVKFIIPFGVLVYTLGVIQLTVMTSALYTAVTMLITGITFPVFQAAYESRSVTAATRETLSDTVAGFRRGAIITAPIAIILAAINGVVDILMTTGVPGILTLSMMDISGGIMLVAVLISMVICILLGLGMPTTAAYTVVALLVAPTLVSRFLVPDLAAHFFVFYGAILSGLTPPIATCAAVAAGIANADFVETCYEAIKVAAPLFVLPFSFIYHPVIVSGVLSGGAVFTGLLILLGGISIIHGINYRFGYGKWAQLGTRVAFFVVGVLTMVYPNSTVQYAGAGVIITLFVVQQLATRNVAVGDTINN
ncbi:C4-dicarboxylate ABC transporter permease [Haloferax sp. Atlit-10N]|uniref:TRAP transporter permease n=1 Tax=Haloferax TaxID=2251 RepID=UPI0009DA1D98|nr:MULTISPECIES: TRAP transporter fused permease subunit [Haloferax]RDZ44894.1 C4-dicarboxylate ABC transporter permease [Haloferax sp. Atlit-16N]RDZ59328.1 C4-dicarboxylate ABC transporter permease [Haloferax sp. Atlit-10N]